MGLYYDVLYDNVDMALGYGIGGQSLSINRSYFCFIDNNAVDFGTLFPFFPFPGSLFFRRMVSRHWLVIVGFIRFVRFDFGFSLLFLESIDFISGALVLFFSCWFSCLTVSTMLSKVVMVVLAVCASGILLISKSGNIIYSRMVDAWCGFIVSIDLRR